MDKLDMKTANIADKNYEILSKLFPNAITETITGYNEDGKAIVERAVDADILRQEISCQVVEGKDERYQFTWPDKKKAILLANAPISATLRPCKEESVDFDDTENVYIEGDNLDVLKILQETYLGKIKLIYIDPPYNTGHDFIYNDNYSKSVEEYIRSNGQYDFYGNQMVPNIESSGRFHSDWLNMMFTRLRLAKNLLSEDGVIVISIDHNEQHNLRKICDEIFGSSSFIADFIWNSRKSVSNDAVVSLNHNYTLVYAKNISVFYENKASFKLPDTGEGFDNPDNDPRGKWKADPFDSPGIRPNLTYKIVNPNTGAEYWPPNGRCWRTGEKEYQEFLKDGRIVFGKNGTSKPQLKRFFTEAQSKGLTPKSLWDDCGTATDGTKEIIDMFGAKVFDTPKPVNFLKRIIELCTDEDSIIMDFFSGSATTAHATMAKNIEDKGKRKYIMVQIPDKCSEKTIARNSGYKTICDIGKARIKKAIEKQERNLEIDTGFRVLRLDSSNMKDIYYNPAETQQSFLDELIDNIKEDRTPEDLLFQVMLDLGVLLSSKIEETEIAGKKVFNVAEGFLIACFDKDITEETVIEVAKKQPYYAVFRDNCMSTDSVATNFDQIFATYSPDTVRKVL